MNPRQTSLKVYPLNSLQSNVLVNEISVWLLNKADSMNTPLFIAINNINLNKISSYKLFDQIETNLSRLCNVTIGKQAAEIGKRTVVLADQTLSAFWWWDSSWIDLCSLYFCVLLGYWLISSLASNGYYQSLRIGNISGLILYLSDTLSLGVSLV